MEAVRSSKIYLFAGRLAESDIRLLAEELLTDPVAEISEVSPGLSHRDDPYPAVEVHTLPGVMNPVAMSTLDAARRLLNSKASRDATLEGVHTARRYEIVGSATEDDLERIAGRVLANDCIETWYIQSPGRSDAIPDSFPSPPKNPFEIRHVGLRDPRPDVVRTLRSQDAQECNPISWRRFRSGGPS